MKNAGKACNNRLYRHIRTFEKIIKNYFVISYKNDVDSFVIVSSDSDYWGLISSLPDAHFLVMIEREKCGPDIRSA